MQMGVPAVRGVGKFEDAVPGDSIKGLLKSSPFFTLAQVCPIDVKAFQPGRQGVAQVSAAIHGEKDGDTTAFTTGEPWRAGRPVTRLPGMHVARIVRSRAAPRCARLCSEATRRSSFV